MSTKVANLTGYITDCDGGEGFAADSERMYCFADCYAHG